MPDGSAYINTTGGPAMAKAGSGDVLAGMILALIGQKFPIKDAVPAAVCIHGLAGGMCADELGEYSVTAGDITAMLPAAVRRIMNYEL
jgi:NAD(P)H-hydrate epimerase